MPNGGVQQPSRAVFRHVQGNDVALNITDEMAQDRDRQVYGHDTPQWTETELVNLLGRALMNLARANPENCTPQVTQALAIFHVWEASRK